MVRRRPWRTSSWIRGIISWSGHVIETPAHDSGFGSQRLVESLWWSPLHFSQRWHKLWCTLAVPFSDPSWKSPQVTYIFIHSLFCLTTGPKPPPKRFFHIVRSRASSFKWGYPLLSLRSSSRLLCLLPRLLVTSVSPFIFPSITCFRRQFLVKMWAIQLAFRFLISCRIFLCSLTLRNTSSFLTWSVQLIFYSLLQHHISKRTRLQISACENYPRPPSYVQLGTLTH